MGIPGTVSSGISWERMHSTVSLVMMKTKVIYTHIIFSFNL